ncbi:MAG: hypothetical protein LBF40_01925 [Deltaproteobacteria bacterium]|nr:hypothetical protein [Deltaproteobacteria bacterium]
MPPTPKKTRKPRLSPAAALAAAALLCLSLAQGCTLDSREHEELRSLREEYLVRIAELRQANDTINRNITATYLELEALKVRLAEEEARRAPNG